MVTGNFDGRGSMHVEPNCKASSCHMYLRVGTSSAMDSWHVGLCCMERSSLQCSQLQTATVSGEPSIVATSGFQTIRLLQFPLIRIIPEVTIPRISSVLLNVCLVSVGDLLLVCKRWNGGLRAMGFKLVVIRFFMRSILGYLLPLLQSVYPTFLFFRN